MAIIIKKKTVLITGGAGYIGSHIAHFCATDYSVVVLDAFIHKQTFTPPWATVIIGHIEDTPLLDSIFSQYQIDIVIHCAASIEVGESVKNPAQFYQNNVVITLSLLNIMRAHNVTKLIFSSSCAIYGTPQTLPLAESHPKNPESPYGNTKYIVELMLQDFCHAYGMSYVILRYFNAAGAYPEQMLGEQHTPESHIIPLLLHAAMEQKSFHIFGDTFDTPDGTAIRDYVHVRDIADAHHKAAAYLQAGNRSIACNVGTGTGVSVKQMVVAINKQLTTTINVIWSEKRDGDPAILVADPTHARQILNWQPHYSSIEHIISSAYEFMHLIKTIAPSSSDYQSKSDKLHKLDNIPRT